MKQNYLSNKLKTLIKGGVLAVSMSFFGLVNAQLSGSYTINSGSATGGTNYNSWSAFATDINSKGVSGAVTVSVITDITTSTQTVFSAISGASATNTITIDGNNKFLAYSGSYEVIAFTGADYVTIKNLKIQHTSTSTLSSGIRFSSGSDYNTIDKCTIEFSAMTSTGSSSAYVYFSQSQGSPTAATSTSPGSYNTISNCLMRTTAANAAGPYFGVSICGNTSSYSSTAQNNTIRGNTIENFYYYGVFNYYSNGNQFLNNDISRANATSSSSTSTTMMAFYSYYTYGTNRSTAFSGNTVHDLPRVGASSSSTTSYINTWYNIYSYYNYGRVTGGNPFVFDGNTFKDIMAYTTIRGDFYYNDVVNLTNNVYTNMQTYTSGTSYMHYIYYGRDYNIVGNKIEKCSLSIASSGTFYAYYVYYYVYNTYRTRNLFNDNVIENNFCGNNFFALYLYFTYASWDIHRNRFVKNTTSTSYGYFYGLYLYYNYNIDVYSNIIADNLGYYGGYHCYTYSYNSGYSANFRQNTLRAGSSSYQYYFMYGWLIQESQSFVTFDGNITEISSNYYVYPAYIYNTSSNNIKSVNWNTFHFPQIVNQYWALGTTGYGTYGAWVTSGIPGLENNYANPNFRNTTTGDYRSNCFETQNNVPTVAAVPNDQSKKKRQTGSSDRGAYEDSMNIKASSTSFSIPAQVCAGYESTADITVTNTYTDTIYNFYVAYSINGGSIYRQYVTNKILPGDSIKVKFTKPMVLSIAGSTKVKIYLDLNDDMQADNSFEYTTFVKPAPGGGKYIFSNKTTTPNNAVYQLSRPFDVTVVNVPVYYNVPAPRIYNNSSYGSALPSSWYASVQAYTKGGKMVSGATITNPNGATDMEVKFETSDATLEDSTLTIVLKVSDLNNGCDTFIKRNILIFPSATPDFKFPSKICDGSDVLFENTSNIKASAALEYFWNFGTGVAADTSNAPEPVFRFPKSGKYDVVLTAKTMPYGFVFTKKIQVTVNDIPTVDFNKTNACLGQDIKFTSVINPSSATANWDFGNGATKTGTNVTYQYPKAGSYMVKLTADLNGCVAEQSARVYQFETPTAGFNLKSGVCDNDMFAFTNTSSIGGGLIGSYWDFNDNGSVSTDDNPTYTFSAAGKKTVKLTVKSEFGCEAVSTKEVEVRESPKVSFTHTPACSITPTEFVNTTNDVSGTVANYNWNMGDGTIKSSKDYTHTWSSLGPKTVTLTVKLNNGCENKISKELNVLTQPKAAFAAADVCAGDPVIFVNNTTWPDGKISYVWDFGDGTFSGSSDPSKNYNVKQTTTYNVTLVASIQGGCADSITQRVIINEAPRTCDFTVEPDYAFSYHGIKVNPLNISGAPGGQANVNYTWVFAGVGTEYSANTNAAVSKDMGSDGEYTITMRAVVAQTGCECSMTKKFVLNRAGMEELAKVGVTVYPNPTAGDIKVMVSETFGTGVVRVKSMSGAELKVMNLNGNLLEVNAGDLSNGVYLVEVSNGKQVVTKKITVQK